MSYLEYSGSSEGESSPVLAENTHGTPYQHAQGDGQGSTHDAEELMLSEFLVSLQGSASHHAAEHMQQAACHAPAATARRTAAAAAGKAPGARRTVVHRRKRRDDLAGPCNHCGALSSPQWRKGPKGKPVLCNACGIRFLRNRTLTKVMPKKRRVGANGKRSRVALAEEGEDDDFADDTLTAADEDMEAEAYSTAAAAAAAAQVYAAMQPELWHQLLLQSGMLAAGNGALFCAAGDATATGAAGNAAAQQELLNAAAAMAPAAKAAAAGGSADANDHAASVPAGKLAPAVPAMSRDSLFSSRSNSSRSLLVQLGDCPSLTIALALHQQEQQRRQQEEQEAEEELQQQSSKYRLPAHFPELQLSFPPSSPPGSSCAGSPARPHHAVLGSSCMATPATSSPVCSSSTFLHLQQCSSGSPPLSPLFLGVTGQHAAEGLLGAAGALPSSPAGAAAAGQPPAGDILQLVQQLGLALGGVGPAIEFLKLCSGNPAALAAAVAAVATSAALPALG